MAAPVIPERCSTNAGSGGEALPRSKHVCVSEALPFDRPLQPNATKFARRKERGCTGFCVYCCVGVFFLGAKTCCRSCLAGDGALLSQFLGSLAVMEISHTLDWSRASPASPKRSANMFGRSAVLPYLQARSGRHRHGRARPYLCNKHTKCNIIVRMILLHAGV